MRYLVTFLLSILASCANADVADEPWPQRIRPFPTELPASVSHGGFRITIRTPADPDVRAAGGSGGPMREFYLLCSRDGQAHTFHTQSVCAVLLDSWRGSPQLEIWGRGGGGYWIRGLYRLVAGEYRAVRYEKFEEWPRRNNEKAATLEPPFAPRGKEEGQGQVLYFVETRIPKP